MTLAGSMHHPTLFFCAVAVAGSGVVEISVILLSNFMVLTSVVQDCLQYSPSDK